MRNFSLNLKPYINKGLASKNNPRNQPLLIESVGAIPYNDALQAIEEFTRIDTSSLVAEFPYPQIFVLSESILVCTETAIYEYNNNNTLTLKISGLPAGTTWDVVDFKSYILMVNGQCAVTRNPLSGDFIRDLSMPFGNCICNYNGQVLLGSPDTNVYAQVIAEAPVVGAVITSSQKITINPEP